MPGVTKRMVSGQILYTYTYTCTYTYTYKGSIFPLFQYWEIWYFRY